MRHIFGIALLTVLLCTNAFSYPRFAVKYEQKCALCHINPTGCGMRNTYGSQYFATGELPAHKIPEDKIVKTNITNFIAVGLDARNLCIYDQNRNGTLYPFIGSGKQSTFFQMEGGLYLNAQLTDRINLYLMKGINSEYEVYGMANYLPYNGYIRIGTFQPSYGWRFQDHTSFVREPLGWAPYYYDTGIEAGIYPGDMSANIGIFNGALFQPDDNQGKALAARLEYRKHVGFMGLGIGGSYWLNDLAPDRAEMYGPFYYLNLFKGNLICLGEFDWQKSKISDTKKYATTHSLSFQLIQGIWLEGDYDFFNPNTKIKGETTKRYSFNFDYFPIPYVEIQPTIRYFDDKEMAKKYWNLLLQTHLYF